MYPLVVRQKSFEFYPLSLARERVRVVSRPAIPLTPALSPSGGEGVEPVSAARRNYG
jgi:hypothetical protein